MKQCRATGSVWFACHPRSASLVQAGIVEALPGRSNLSCADPQAVLQEGFTTEQRVYIVLKTPNPLKEEFKDHFAAKDGKACVRSVTSALAAGQFRLALRLLRFLKPVEVSGVMNMCSLGVEEAKWFDSS